jgi:hypothetical protein
VPPGDFASEAMANEDDRAVFEDDFASGVEHMVPIDMADDPVGGQKGSSGSRHAVP